MMSTESAMATFEEVEHIIRAEGHLPASVTSALKQWCIEEDWEPIYRVSAMVGLELGMLVDQTGRVWLDWGGPGRVVHSPPDGARIPFELWLHTHPNMDAYWSPTDQSTLKMGHSIIERAIVLGRPGFLQALKHELDGSHSIEYPDLPWFHSYFCEWTQDRRANTAAGDR